MTAPSASTRTAPDGIKLDDGYQTLVVLGRAPDICFWEKTVKPPALDGGDPVNTTTMWNERWRTKNSRALIEMGDITLKVAYDPKIYTDILQLVNINDTCTIRFPDGSTIAFYGFLYKFEPDDLEEGTQPEATVTICVTNQDPDTGEEEDPVVVEVAGT